MEARDFFRLPAVAVPGSSVISLPLLVILVLALWLAAEGRGRRAPTWRVRPIDATEVAFAALLLATLFSVAIAAYDYPTVRMRAVATEALNLATSQEICMHEAWAVTGDIPPGPQCVQTDHSRGHMASHVTAVEAARDQPRFDYVFGTQSAPNGGPRLSVTLAAGPGTPPATLTWRCASAPLASDMTSLADDRSTLAWRTLPSSCRTRRPDAEAR